MAFRAFVERNKPTTILGKDWDRYLDRKIYCAPASPFPTIMGADANRYDRVSRAIELFIISSALYVSISLCLKRPLLADTSLSFPVVRDCMLASSLTLPTDATPGDIFINASFASGIKGHAFRYRPSVGAEENILTHDLTIRLSEDARRTGVVELFAHGMSRSSLMRQVLHDLRYPWPGRVATDNAPALIKSFWWRPPFEADRITVFVTPDNPALLDSLCAEFPEPFQTEWGQTLSVAFEPLHNRD